ncbi:hypothetical protein ACOLNO_002946 [Vibrio parahaemolyticus]
MTDTHNVNLNSSTNQEPKPKTLKTKIDEIKSTAKNLIEKESNSLNAEKNLKLLFSLKNRLNPIIESITEITQESEINQTINDGFFQVIDLTINASKEFQKQWREYKKETGFKQLKSKNQIINFFSKIESDLNTDSSFTTNAETKEKLINDSCIVLAERVKSFDLSTQELSNLFEHLLTANIKQHSVKSKGRTAKRNSTKK